MAEFLTKTSLIFKEMGTSVSKLILKIPVLGRFLGALGGFAAKALIPFTALYLLLDDIATYTQGGDSLIGRVLNWFQETGGDFSKIFGKMFGGDFMGGLQELIVKLIDVIDDFVQVLLQIASILTGLPLDKWGQKFANWVSQGTYDNLKNYEYGLPTPAMQQNVRNNNTSSVTNNDNKVSMTNYIQTSQPAFDIQNQLTYARNAMATGWA